MKTKTKPPQPTRDVVDALISACPGDIHGQHPCERCNYCTARQQIVYFRKRDKAKKAALKS